MKKLFLLPIFIFVTVLFAQKSEVAVIPDDESEDPGLKVGDIAPSWALMSGTVKFEFLAK